MGSETTLRPRLFPKTLETLQMLPTVPPDPPRFLHLPAGGLLKLSPSLCYRQIC
jgi:hypothetical protein